MPEGFFEGVNSGACGNGVTLIGDNTGNVYRYCHMKTPTELEQGAHVNAGEYIADMGTSGGSDAIHLHFGVRNQLVYDYYKHYDPCGFLQTVCTESGELGCKNREQYGAGAIPGFSSSSN